MPPTAPNVAAWTRQELYEMIWTTPMRNLAASFGLSYVDLANHCTVHNIPRPPAGYWRKKEFGKAPLQTPLPDVESAPSPVSFPKRQPQKSVTKSKPPEPNYDHDIRSVLERAQALPRLKLADRLHRLHPLVRATKLALMSAEPDQHHLLQPDRYGGGQAIRVAVGKECVHRALALLDVLVKTVAKLEGKVEDVENSRQRETVVVMCGERVASIRLRERYRQVPRKSQPKDPCDWQKCDYVLTGQLVLDSGSSERRICQDTEAGQSIEDSLNELIIGWIKVAGWQRIGRRNAEEAHRRREEADRQRRDEEARLQQLRMDLQQRQKIEQLQVDKLLADAVAWRTSKMVRDYVNEVEQFRVRDGPVEPGSALAVWLAWARQQADRIDPLVPSPHSVLDERL